MAAKKKSRSSKPKSEEADKVVAKEILEAVQQLRAELRGLGRPVQVGRGAAAHTAVAAAVPGAR